MIKKINKVLLFVPPAYTFKDNLDINPLPPLGLAYIAAVLDRRGIEVKIVDCLMEGWHDRVDIHDNVIRVGLPFDKIEQIIADFRPDIVGVNNLFTKQRNNAHKIYELAKKVDSGITTIAGGAHPTVLPKLVLADANVDFVVLGEGENTMLDIVDVLEGKKEVNNLDGAGFRLGGEIKINPKTRFIENLDDIPFPARDLLNLEKYHGLNASHGQRKRERFSPIITSRGCPAKCTFCSANKVWGHKYRYRSAENVIAEMRELKEKYRIEELMFEDDNFTMNITRAEQILDAMINEKLDFVWDTPNGVAVYALNENLIAKMKASGCYKLNMAIETGNQWVMDNLIKKPLKLAKVKPLVEYARMVGLEVGMFLVIGMPGETEEQMWDSFRFAAELEIYTPHVSIATPYPGSELYNICVENKFLTEDFSLDDLYIRSYSITTPDWDGEKLAAIQLSGSRYLKLQYLKTHPWRFTKDIIIPGLTQDPVYFLKRAWRLLTN